MSKIRYINVTPHRIDFRDPCTGEDFSINPSGILLNAFAVQVVTGMRGNIEYVTQKFLPTQNGLDDLHRLESKYSSPVIVGSVLSAMAYPSRVLAMVDSPGIFDGIRKNPLRFSMFSCDTPRCEQCGTMLTEENIARDEMGYPRNDFYAVLWCKTCHQKHILQCVC